MGLLIEIVSAERLRTMPSPFPGMNPYLEQEVLWQDFHINMLAAIKERLVPQVRPRYFVLLERYIYVHEQPDEPPKRLRADFLVAGPEGAGRQPTGAALLEVPAPAEVEHREQEGERVAFLEIRDRARGEVITLLEMLSPANKHDDHQQYLTRRAQLLDSAAHLVEIDLLRGGRPMPDDHRPDCDYSVLVSRSERRPRAAFWPIRLRDRLPVIPIPLRPTDSDARIDLQEVLHRVYDTSGYEDFIYAASPEPPLSSEDAAWAKQFVTPGG
jgi:hypothetical protein